MYNDRNPRPAKDTGERVEQDINAEGSRLTTGVTTGETPEAIVKDVNVRLCAYRCARKAIHGIHRPWGWHASCDDIYPPC